LTPLGCWCAGDLHAPFLDLVPDALESVHPDLCGTREHLGLLLGHMLSDQLYEHAEFRFQVPVAGAHVEEFLHYVLGGVMLLLGVTDKVFHTGSFHRRVEDLLFQLRVYHQLGYGLIDDCLTRARVVRLVELSEQFADFSVVVSQDLQSVHDYLPVECLSCLRANHHTASYNRTYMPINQFASCSTFP
jgi:hypothetical protein